MATSKFIEPYQYVNRAVETNQRRNWLTTPWYQDTRIVGTDGVRLHYVAGQPRIDGHRWINADLRRDPPNIDAVYPEKLPPVSAIIKPTKEDIKVLKTLDKLAERESSRMDSILATTTDGDAIQICTGEDSKVKWSFKISVCQKLDQQPIDGGIRIGYLADALIPDVVTHLRTVQHSNGSGMLLIDYDHNLYRDYNALILLSNYHRYTSPWGNA